MTKTISVVILLIFFGASSGALLSFIAELPATSEMGQYEKEFNAVGDQGVSPERFEELKALSEESMKSMRELNFASKDFAVDFIVIPVLALMLAYLWFKAGVYLSGRSHQVAYRTVAICALVLFVFGYLYQPLIHVVALVVGVFWDRVKDRADFSE